MPNVCLNFSYTIVGIEGALSVIVDEATNNLWHKNTGSHEALCRQLLLGQLVQEAIITNIRLSETEE